MTAWEDAQEQHRGAAMLAEAEASWLGEDPMALAELRALHAALGLFDVARDHLLVIRARLDGEQTFGYSPADLHEAANNYRMVRGDVADLVRRLADRWADSQEEDTP